MNRRTFLATIAATALAARAADGPATAPTATSPATRPTGVRVMSFNIRYGTARDGDDAWPKRKAFVVDTIKAYDPDLLGMQEVLADQGDYVSEQLPGYAYVGGGRDDGKRGGEASPIMYRKSRFEEVANGMAWLSETPEKVGSKGWDAALPRVVTWAKLKDLAGGPGVLFVNTHWDHMGKVARVESGKLMRKLIGGWRDKSPVAVTGDFNSTEDSPQYASLLAADAGSDWRLHDAYRDAHPTVAAEEASFHEFKGGVKGKRIDWVLRSPEWRTTGAAIVRTSRNGRYPSDHYPVTAELELK